MAQCGDPAETNPWPMKALYMELRLNFIFIYSNPNVFSMEKRKRLKASYIQMHLDRIKLQIIFSYVQVSSFCRLILVAVDDIFSNLMYVLCNLEHILYI